MRSAGHVMCTGKREVRSKPYTISLRKLQGRTGIPKGKSKYNIKENFYKNKALWRGFDSMARYNLQWRTFANFLMVLVV